MTEERKKYLANIGREELEIRKKIIQLKRVVRFNKLCLNTKGCSDLVAFMLWTPTPQSNIRETKAIIQSLKKQLPAPRKEIDIGLYWAIFNCPKCRTTIPIHAGYCLCCGQKLRE